MKAMLRRCVSFEGLVACRDVIKTQFARCGALPATPHDPRTWPKDWTATEIKDLLRGELRTPHSPPSYESLALLHKFGYCESLTDLLRLYVKAPTPKTVDLDAYLARSLGDSRDRAAMPLQERERQLDDVAEGLSQKAGSDKRNIVCCYSPRGSGKTQFIKHFVFTKRAEAMKYGRVIVRCCDKAMHESSEFDKTQPSWIHRIFEDGIARVEPVTSVMLRDNVKTFNATDQGLCSLVRKHVESVTGRVQYPSYYCDPPTAYATWIRETARHFEIPSTAENVEPLIIIDTCELLAAEEHKSLVHTCSRKPYTLLEAFCRSVPAPYSIFVLGCKTILNVDHLLLTMANMRRVRPLAPLSNDAFIKSLAESWGAKSDDELIKLQHHWAGGTPRLLRQSGFWSERSKSDTVESASEFSRCLEAHVAIARSQYPLHPQLLPFAYSCMLASSTKATVRSDEIIPLNPAWNIIGHRRTFNDAMIESIGSHDLSTNRFMVPPITVRDELMTELRHEVPILPSQLDPFIDADFIAHYPLQLNEDRGRIFTKTFVYAVYARYLLAHWKDTKTSWVSLCKVFEGAVRPDQVPLLKQWEVNLSGGVTISARTFKQHSLTYTAHDAYIWCRDKHKRGNKMQMRLRREDDVTSRSLSSFVLTLCRDDAGAVNGLNDVVIDADAMSSACGMISL